MITKQNVCQIINVKDLYQLTGVDFNKQNELDADPTAIKQIELYEMLDTNRQVKEILEKTKEVYLDFCK